jgi:hypothetical protein
MKCSQEDGENGTVVNVKLTGGYYESMDEPVTSEHGELLSLLFTATQESRLNLSPLKDVTSIFSGHADREEETMVPVLEFFRSFTGQGKIPDVDYLRIKADEFRTEEPVMLKEHREIMDLLGRMEREDGTVQLVLENLSAFMERHSNMEEYYLYPLAFHACSLIDSL